MTAVQTKPLYRRLDDENNWTVSSNVQNALESVKAALMEIKTKSTYDDLSAALDDFYVALGLPVEDEFDPEQYPNILVLDGDKEVRFTGDDES